MEISGEQDFLKPNPLNSNCHPRFALKYITVNLPGKIISSVPPLMKNKTKQHKTQSNYPPPQRKKTKTKTKKKTYSFAHDP